jgi:hypothetical protein
MQGRDGGFQPGGTDGVEEGRGDDPIDLAGEEGLADGLRIVGLGPPAFVAAMRVPPAIADAHPAPAAAAHHQPMQQGGAVTRRAAAPALEVGEVVAQLAPVRQVGVEAQVGGIDALNDDVPRLRRASPVRRRRRVTRRHLAFDPAVDEGTGIGRVDEHLLDHLVGRPHPHDPAGLRAVLDQPRQRQAVLQEVPLHGPPVAQHREALEHGGHGQANGFVGVEDGGAVRSASVADRQADRQLPAARFVEQGALHTRLEDVRLRGE